MNKGVRTQPKPEFLPLELVCGNCNTEWIGWQPSMVPVEVWMAYVGALRCPECGKGPESLMLRLSAAKP